MKKILIIILLSSLAINPAVSETFSAALLKAYQNNSDLNAERENINVSEQDLEILNYQISIKPLMIEPIKTNGIN